MELMAMAMAMVTMVQGGLQSTAPKNDQFDGRLLPDGSIRCQHGPDECTLNRMETCLLNFVPAQVCPEPRALKIPSPKTRIPNLKPPRAPPLPTCPPCLSTSGRLSLAHSRRRCRR